MLLDKNDPTCVKMIDFGLSKDFTGQESMSTMSGSVSNWFCPNLFCLAVFSLIISPQKYFYKTIIQRLISGLLVLFSTSCYQEKCHSQVTQNLKSLATSSREISTLITNHSKDTLNRLRSSCLDWFRKMSVRGTQQYRPLTIPGSNRAVNFPNSLFHRKHSLTCTKHWTNSKCVRPFWSTWVRRSEQTTLLICKENFWSRQTRHWMAIISWSLCMFWEISNECVAKRIRRVDRRTRPQQDR